MGIVGTFRIGIPKNNLRNMQGGTCGYIYCENFRLGKNLLCIPLCTEVFYSLEDMYELNYGTYVSVYKFDDGFSSDSFEIDLTEDPNFDIEDWELLPESLLLQYAKSKDWIVFKNPPIFLDEIDSLDELDKESLQEHENANIDENIKEKYAMSVSLQNLNQAELQKLP